MESAQYCATTGEKKHFAATGLRSARDFTKHQSPHALPRATPPALCGSVVSNRNRVPVALADDSTGSRDRRSQGDTASGGMG